MGNYVRKYTVLILLFAFRYDVYCYPGTVWDKTSCKCVSDYGGVVVDSLHHGVCARTRDEVGGKVRKVITMFVTTLILVILIALTIIVFIAYRYRRLVIAHTGMVANMDGKTEELDP